MSVKVAISTVADGDMLKTKGLSAKHRAAFLEANNMSESDAYMFHPHYDTDDFCRYYVLESDDIPRIDGDPHRLYADAVVTTTPGTSLMLPVADCIGTVLYDERQNIVMVSHLGRHNLEQSGGTKSVAYLTETFHSQPKDIKVWTTPAPGKDIYPIWALDNKGMKEVFFEQMDAAGVPRENITDHPSDTAKDLNYFSYSEFSKGNRDQDGDYAIVAQLN